MAHEVHPKKIIKTDKGNIVMEMPDFYRQTALSNSVYTYILTDEELLELNNISDADERDKYLKIRSMRKGYTSVQLTVLSYVTEAPFHLNDYSKDPILDLKSFLDFVDKGLFTEMVDKMTELGKIDPLS